MAEIRDSISNRFSPFVSVLLVKRGGQYLNAWTRRCVDFGNSCGLWIGEMHGGASENCLGRAHHAREPQLTVTTRFLLGEKIASHQETDGEISEDGLLERKVAG